MSGKSITVTWYATIMDKQVDRNFLDARECTTGEELTAAIAAASSYPARYTTEEEGELVGDNRIDVAYAHLGAVPPD